MYYVIGKKRYVYIITRTFLFGNDEGYCVRILDKFIFVEEVNFMVNWPGSIIYFNFTLLRNISIFELLQTRYSLKVELNVDKLAYSNI